MLTFGFLTRKSSITACCAWTVALIVLSMAAGLTSNRFSRHPLSLSPERKTGIEFIDLARALLLHEQKILFVDARSPDAFNDGHIPGAYNFYFFNVNGFVTEFTEKFDRSDPLIVYCEGISGSRNEDTCETSRLLAQQLAGRGYRSVMVFEQGFAFWEKGGHPVDRGSGADKSGKHGTMPISSYLRDLIMLVIGIAVMVMAKKQPFVAVVQLLLGIIFIVSGSTKIFSPEKLAVIIEAYRILPAAFIPYAAIGMPWVELFAGLALVSGLLPSSGALTIIGMQLFFIPALSYRMLFLARQLGISVFNVDFDCGCGLGENFAWVLILRDVGFLMMGAAVLVKTLRAGKDR